ncbi:uncharacterized protein IWZ02DRAFT_515080 [Phyllosticta citriasiana]|uniref:uncharacterized protein n=1 Tax=Phyllosticta citriasiana TaxID=595635 RepID=UPI0030FDF0F0
MEAMKSLQESRKALQNGSPVSISYTFENSKPLMRINDSMAQLHEGWELDWERAALVGYGNMNDCMLDFFEGIEQDVRSSRAMDLVQSRLTTGQAAAVAMTRSLPHGLGIVQGPPGTGKTFMISNLVQPLLFTSEPRRGPSVLILSTSNLSVDDITMRYAGAISHHEDRDPSQDPIPSQAEQFDDELN